jgi:hypothetical protein
MIHVERYTAQHQAAWDLFVDNAKNATFLFKRAFMEYHTHRFIDHSLLFWDDNELVAIFPANETETNIWSHKGLSYGGLVLKTKTNLPSVLIYFEELKKYYEGKKFTTVFYKSLPAFYCSSPAYEEEYALFKLNALRLKVEVNSIIDLQSPLHYSRNRERAIQKAIHHQLFITEDADFDPFWGDILIPNRWEKHRIIPAHSLEDIRLLKSRFPENIVHFNVFKEADLVAGGTIFLTNGIVHTQYIAANESGKTVGAADFLVDYLIKKYASDYKYLSFGISTDTDGLRLNEGLFKWKSGFDATVFPHYTYKIDL